MSDRKWFMRWGSSIVQEVISGPVTSVSLISLASYKTENGWKSYSGSEHAEEEPGRYITEEEFTRRFSCIQTIPVANILKKMTAVEDFEEEDILEEANALVADNKDFFESNKRTPEIRGFHYYLYRVNGHKGWRTTVKTLDETTVLKAHITYIKDILEAQ